VTPITDHKTTESRAPSLQILFAVVDRESLKKTDTTSDDPNMTTIRRLGATVSCVLLLVSPVEAVRTQVPNGIPKKRRKSTRFDRIVQTIFDDADANKDGHISFDECYELVLKLYINLNRQAPIPPPTRYKVQQLFASNDVDHNHQISRQEFQSLSQILVGQAATRLVAHKVVTLLCAPLLAEWVVRQLQQQSWLPALIQWLVPDRIEPRVLPILTSQALGRTVVIIAFVATLGNIILDLVNKIVDLYTLKDDDRSNAKSSTGRSLDHVRKRRQGSFEASTVRNGYATI
jgi:EF hand